MKSGMKKSLAVLSLSASIAFSGTMLSYAGEWKQDAIGYWYQNDDNSFAKSGWQWIDGNGDGVAECYYFSPEGSCLLNSTTPDGFNVDGSGAWVIDGYVQTKVVNNTEKKKTYKKFSFTELSWEIEGNQYGVSKILEPFENWNGGFCKSFRTGYMTNTDELTAVFYTDTEYKYIAFNAESWNSNVSFTLYGDNDEILDVYNIPKGSSEVFITDIEGQSVVRLKANKSQCTTFFNTIMFSKEVEE